MVSCIISTDGPLSPPLKGSALSEKYFGFPGKEDHKYQVCACACACEADTADRLKTAGLCDVTVGRTK